jgi:hypothetical protein
VLDIPGPSILTTAAAVVAEAAPVSFAISCARSSRVCAANNAAEFLLICGVTTGVVDNGDALAGED